MPWGIETHMLVVDLLFITALNVLVLHGVFIKRSLESLIAFTALPWILVPIMAIHPRPGYTAMFGAMIALVWDALLLWPTYLILSGYGVYLLGGRTRTVAQDKLDTINA